MIDMDDLIDELEEEITALRLRIYELEEKLTKLDAVAMKRLEIEPD